MVPCSTRSEDYRFEHPPKRRSQFSQSLIFRWLINWMRCSSWWSSLDDMHCRLPLMLSPFALRTQMAFGPKCYFSSVWKVFCFCLIWGPAKRPAFTPLEICGSCMDYSVLHDYVAVHDKSIWTYEHTLWSRYI